VMRYNANFCISNMEEAIEERGYAFLSSLPLLMQNASLFCPVC
jgi:hypothetical protein